MQLASSATGNHASNAADLISELICWGRLESIGLQTEIAQALIRGRVWHLMNQPPNIDGATLSSRLGVIGHMLKWHRELCTTAPGSQLLDIVWLCCAAISPEIAVIVRQELPGAMGAKALAVLTLLHCAVIARCSEVDVMLCCAGVGEAVLDFARQNRKQCVLRNAAADVLAALLTHDSTLIAQFMRLQRCCLVWGF